MEKNTPRKESTNKGFSCGGVAGLAIALVAMAYSACTSCKKDEQQPILEPEILPGYENQQAQDEFYRLTRTVARELSAEGYAGINRTELRQIKTYVDDLTESPGVTLEEVAIAKQLHEALVARLQTGTAFGYRTQKEIIENRGPESLFPQQIPAVYRRQSIDTMVEHQKRKQYARMRTC